MAEPRDIFIVCNTIEEAGGLQQWAHTMGRLFAGLGHRVHLIGINRPADVRDYGANPPYAATVLLPTPVRNVPRPRGPRRANLAAQVRWHRRQSLMDQVGRRLTQMFQGARPGSVIIVAQIWAMEWVLRADTAGLKVIGMSHESFQASRDSTRYNRVKRYYRDVDRMLVLTEEDADQWACDGMSNVAAMPNPLTVSPRTVPTLDEPTVVTLARLSHEKGIDLLLEAWARVAPLFHGWRLKIYGSGAEEASLRAQTKELGIEARTDFCGHTSDIDGALAAASIYALPSRNEGLPIAMMEAMAYGLPPVAFDCAPGVREMVTEEVSGLLAGPGNVSAFATALERLMKDADLRRRVGAGARESVARFAPSAVLDRWESLFGLMHR